MMMVMLAPVPPSSSLPQGEGEVEMEADTLVENLPGGFSLSSSTISLVINFTFGLVFPLPFFLYKKGWFLFYNNPA